MHKIALPGISKESKDELVYTAATVRSNHVIALRPEPIPPKESKKLRRRLKASHNLHLENGAVWHSSGASVSAIASWVGIVQITVNESCRRYRLLAFDRCGERSLFAIPIDIVDQFDTLPSTDYSAGEVKLLRLMADEVSGQEATREYYIALPHPARRDILWQRDRWCEEPDREALIEILRQRDWLIPVIAAALDVHLRSFKIFRDGPLGIYNITLSSNDLQADENFCSVLRALNFTAAPSFMGMAVPEIFVRDKDDLRAWRGCHDRLILIRTATGSLLTPLLDEIDERERLRSCGGILPPRLLQKLFHFLQGQHAGRLLFHPRRLQIFRNIRLHQLFPEQKMKKGPHGRDIPGNRGRLELLLLQMADIGIESGSRDLPRFFDPLTLQKTFQLP